MTLHRFFVSPDNINENVITLPEEISHQITQVLRLKNNDQIIILDNTGFEYLLKITDINKKHTQTEIIEKRKNNNEPETIIHIYMALIARDNFELVLQKSTELGIKEITPVITERTQFDKKFAEQKYERWNKILKEASEQSERAFLPILNPTINFESAINESNQNGKSFIASEYARTVIARKESLVDFRPRQSHINIFIGPEGGFTEQEIKYANNNNIESISLGKTILRAETAAIALITKLLI